jgi:hypothetical protein
LLTIVYSPPNACEAHEIELSVRALKDTSHIGFYDTGPRARAGEVDNYIQFAFNMRPAESRRLFNPAFDHIGVRRVDATDKPVFERCVRTFINEPTGWESEGYSLFANHKQWREGCELFGCARCFWSWVQRGSTLEYVDLYADDGWITVDWKDWAHPNTYTAGASANPADAPPAPKEL